MDPRPISHPHHLPVRRETWMGLVILSNLVFWAVCAIHELWVRGLFVDLGGDWASFWGATQAFERISPAAGYHLPAIAAATRPLSVFTHDGARGARIGPAPYPPVFLDFFSLFTALPPVVGYLLWTAISAVVAVLVFKYLASRAGLKSPWMYGLFLASSYPVMMALFVGQVVSILLVCVLLAFVDFEDGREFRGGFWLGLLALKPQYASCLALVILLKRRWAALGGISLGVSVVLAASLIAGGLSGVVSYGRELVTSYPSFAGSIGVDPRGQLSWRSFISMTLPGLGPGWSLALVVALSLLTIIALPVIWRGPWNPQSVDFAMQFLATMAVTLLVAYQSQPHGAALLLIPGILVVIRSRARAFLPVLFCSAIAAAPWIGLISALTLGNLWLVSLAITGLLVAVVIVTLGKVRWTTGPALAVG
jgi:glycosyl transferase family 87